MSIAFDQDLDPVVKEARKRLLAYGINQFNASRLAQLFLAFENPFSIHFSIQNEEKNRIRADLTEIMRAKSAADLRSELRHASDELLNLCYLLSGKKRRKKAVQKRKYKVVTEWDVPFIENEVLRDLLLARAPHRPYCCDEYVSNSPRDLDVALTKRHIQLNPPGYSSFVVIDVDRAGAAVAWLDAGLPPPTWTAKNPANGHAHIVYALKGPIWRNGDNKKPARYVDAILNAYCLKLDGDPDYANLLSKNPTHADWITTSECNFKLYELDELAEYVDLVGVMPSKRKATKEALGRNCLVFDAVRVWAYWAVRRYSDSVTFGAAVMGQVENVNATLQEPMHSSETRHIAKSITRWVWRHMGNGRGTTSSALAAKQAELGRRSGEARRAKSGRLARGMAAAVSNLSLIESQRHAWRVRPSTSAG